MKAITATLIAITLVILMISCGDVSKETSVNNVKERFPNDMIYTVDCLGSQRTFFVMDTTNNKIFLVTLNNMNNSKITSIKEMCKIQ